jgi:hypothetical protein
MKTVSVGSFSISFDKYGTITEKGRCEKARTKVSKCKGIPS